MTPPPRLLLNIDTGERGAHHAVDHALIAHADVVNLACGGHAGDEESVAVFSALAKRHGTRVAAHLSYPDPQNFGRKPMDLPFAALAQSLDTQRQMLPEPKWIKLHGALYHAADTDPRMAECLAAWLQHAGFTTVITPEPGALALAARERGLSVLAEVFAERRYHRNPATGRVELMPRSNPAACLTTLNEALAQARALSDQRVVSLHPDAERHAVKADTLCIHSDSPIAESLALALRDPGRRAASPGGVA